MRINDMMHMQNYNINKLMGTNREKTEGKHLAFDKRFTAISEPFKAIDWNHMATKSEPKMSDEEFEKAIWEMAQRDAANGVPMTGSGDEKAKLRSEYVSVVSPDRKAAYNESMNKTGGKMNASYNFFDKKGSSLMHYNNASGIWLPHSTSGELDRMKNFNEIYRKAYQAYEAEHGKVNVPTGTPQVKTLYSPY